MDRSRDSIVHHLFFIIQASLEAAWLRITPDKWYGTTQWAVKEAFEPAMDLKDSWKVYIIAALWMTGHGIYSSISCWLHFLIWTMWYQYVYRKNYKDFYTYHQVFCCPESVNTKWDNLILYGTKFTYCVCTGYYKNWTLSLLSFIMNSHLK